MVRRHPVVQAVPAFSPSLLCRSSLSRREPGRRRIKSQGVDALLARWLSLRQKRGWIVFHEFEKCPRIATFSNRRH